MIHTPLMIFFISLAPCSKILKEKPNITDNPKNKP